MKEQKNQTLTEIFLTVTKREWEKEAKRAGWDSARRKQYTQNPIIIFKE